MGTLTREELISGVKECVAESLAIDTDNLTEKTLLIKELDADSLDVMDIMFQLEEKFSINLQKEDFNFVKRLGLTDEEALTEGKLTDLAKDKLLHFLPSLDTKQELKPADLGQYLSLESLVIMVQDHA